MPSGDPILTVEELRVSFATEEGVVQAVDGVSLELQPGEVLAVVGESGGQVRDRDDADGAHALERALRGQHYKGTS